MKQVAHLQISRQRRKYNDVVRKKLTAAGIKFKEEGSRYGIKLMASEVDFDKAAMIVLGVSHTNPKYN